MPDEAFPIANLTTGEVTARKPWIIAKEAFSRLTNCELFRGVLQKKRGYVAIGEGDAIDNKMKGGNGKSAASDHEDTVMGLLSLYEGNAATLLALSETRANRWDHDNNKFVDLTRVRLHISGGTATAPTTTPVAGNVINDGTGNTAEATIEKVILHSGTFQTQSFSATLILKTSSYTGTFADGASIYLNPRDADGLMGIMTEAEDLALFTGEDNQFFQGTSWDDTLYFCNGATGDGVYQFNGEHYWPLVIDLNTEGGGSNSVTQAKCVFLYKSRLLILETAESGNRHRQRARWSEVNLPGTWKHDKYIDAPTDQTIQMAAFIDEDLVCWFDRSVWRLIYTGNADLPFEWRRISSDRGLRAPYSLVTLSGKQFGIGKRELLSSDGRFVTDAGVQIPDFVSKRMMVGKEDYSFGHYFVDLHQSWTTYVDANDTDGLPGHILVHNHQENTFARFEMDVHCLGETYANSDPRLDDIDEELDDIETKFDEAEELDGEDQVVLLAGNRNGEIFQVNVGGSHDGSDYGFEALTGRWNPYIKSQKSAHCSRLRLLVEAHGSTTFDVDHYIDTNNTPLQTWSDIKCEGTSLDKETVWITINVNACGRFHRFRFYNSEANNTPRFHAIVPFFRPAGALYS